MSIDKSVRTLDNLDISTLRYNLDNKYITKTLIIKKLYIDTDEKNIATNTRRLINQFPSIKSLNINCIADLSDDLAYDSELIDRFLDAVQSCGFVYEFNCNQNRLKATRC